MRLICQLTNTDPVLLLNYYRGVLIRFDPVEREGKFRIYFYSFILSKGPLNWGLFFCPFYAVFSQVDAIECRVIMKYVQSSINTNKREDIDGTGKEKRQFRRQDTTEQTE